MKKIIPYQDTIKPFQSHRVRETIIKDDVLSKAVGNKPLQTARIISQWVKSDQKKDAEDFDEF